MTKNHRGNYTYDLIGTLQGQKLKRNPKYTQHYYQLQILCENFPHLTKIFAFKSKTSPEVWSKIEQGECFGSRYHFWCRNYSGHYYLVDWKLLSNNLENQGSTKKLARGEDPTENNDYDQN